jgi:hypothetical protein
MLISADPPSPARAPGRAAVGLCGAGFLFLAACGGDSDPADLGPGEQLVPLEAGTWFLHEADGTPVPGVILPLPGASGPERVQVDSARFVAEANGAVTYEAWLVRTEPDGTEWNVSALALGNWVAGSEAYTLTLGSSGGGMLLRPTPAGDLEGEETHTPANGGAVFPVVYRVVPPSSG